VGACKNFNGLEDVVQEIMESTSAEMTNRICFFIVGLYRKMLGLSNWVKECSEVSHV
jgi:hypothetical protein